MNYQEYIYKYQEGGELGGLKGLARLGGYFVPGVGTVLSAQDAFRNFKKGNIGMGLMDTAFALTGLIPGLGAVSGTLRGLGSAAKLARGLKGIQQAGKLEKGLVRAGTAVNRYKNTLKADKGIIGAANQFMHPFTVAKDANKWKRRATGVANFALPMFAASKFDSAVQARRDRNQELLAAQPKTMSYQDFVNSHLNQATT